jgi:rhamnulose-1-phosphate aldolase
MAVETPYPDLDEIMLLIGEAGKRLSEIDASEGAAGNISVYMGWEIDPRRKFPLVQTINLPEPVPELSKGGILVTGSGRRLRDVIDDPVSNLGYAVVEPDGKTAKLYTSPTCLFARPTSEFNSHLAIHQDQIRQTGTNFHAVIHAQPPYLTYLSHVTRYQDSGYLNQHILRWQPELIVQLPEGVGYIPFCVPGSNQLMEATLKALRTHRIALWGKHGVIARSDLSVKRVADRIEYAETGARYEYMNLAIHEQGEGLSVDEIRAVCAAFNVKQTIF